MTKNMIQHFCRSVDGKIPFLDDISEGKGVEIVEMF